MINVLQCSEHLSVLNDYNRRMCLLFNNMIKMIRRLDHCSVESIRKKINPKNLFFRLKKSSITKLA